MPLIKSTATASQAPPVEPPELLLERLSGSDPDDRRRTARALAHDPQAAPILAARLPLEHDAAVLDALFGSLVEIGGPASAALVAEMLRSNVASLRGGAVEALKSMEEDAVSVLDSLLDDPDPDVRILVIEVARVWPCGLAVPRLQYVFENDLHVNVCGAAVDVATEVGTAELIGSLGRLRLRFADEPFLGFAIDVACSRIHAAIERTA